MELFFLIVLIVLMVGALGSGFPVAFALPGSAILTILLAAVCGFAFQGDTDAFFHSGGPGEWLSAGVTNLRGVYWEVERDTLIAIPLFIFMGIMLQRSKIAEDLLLTMAQLFGPVPGGLGISVVFVGALLAATTGIVGATVVAMGLISLPAMLRNNYSQSLATGTIAASGTLGQIIPPSIVLIILADQLASASDQASSARKVLYREANGDPNMPSVFDIASTSAGEMFLGALIPGIVLVLLYMAYIFVYAIINPKAAPAITVDTKRDGRFWAAVALALLPPLTLIFLVLGSILFGIATVNQAGAIGAAGAVIMAGYKLVPSGRMTFAPALLAVISLLLIAFALARYNMNIKLVLEQGSDATGLAIGTVATICLVASLVWSGLRVFRLGDAMGQVMVETAKTTSLVFAILLGAAILTSAFRAFGGEELVRDFLQSLSGGFWVRFIIVMAVIFFLGFFLEFIEIAVVVVPIVAPILLSDPEANVTAVWLGVMIGLNMQTSFLTPPFGFALFYLRGVAPKSVPTQQIYKGVVPFIMLQLLALGIVGYFPKLVNYMPQRVSYLSETAPPPRNPTMQYCLEDYVWAEISKDPTQVAMALETIAAKDMSMLPTKTAKGLAESFDKGHEALAELGKAMAFHALVTEATPGYRPLQRTVRGLEREMRGRRAEVDHLKRELSYLNSDEADRKQDMEARLAVVDAEIIALQSQIPAEWAAVHDAFAENVKAETRARQTYRRMADDSVEAAQELVAHLERAEAFLAQKPALDALSEVIRNSPQEDAEQAAASVVSAINNVDATGDVRSLMSKAKRALRAKSYDPEKAGDLVAQAQVAFAAQAEWRRAAQTDLAPALETYLAALSNTIGARQQDRLSRPQALAVASCTAAHRDISSQF